MSEENLIAVVQILAEMGCVGILFDELVEIGLRPTQLVEHMSAYEMCCHAEDILDDGMSADEFLRSVGAEVEECLNEGNDSCLKALLCHGADATMLVEMASDGLTPQHLKLFREFGASEEAIAKSIPLELSRSQRRRFGLQLEDKRVTAHTLLENMDKGKLGRYCGEVLDLGVYPELAAAALDPIDLADNMEVLIQHGADPNSVAALLPQELKFEFCEELIELGVKLNANELVEYIKSANIGNPEVVSYVAIMTMDGDGLYLDGLEKVFKRGATSWLEERDWDDEGNEDDENDEDDDGNESDDTDDDVNYYWRNNVLGISP